MDYSWRPRPPIQGNICPTCSISHFPFCPPHPLFNENPRSQSHNDLFLQRPRFEAFIDHLGHTTNLHRPFVGDPSDGFADRRRLHGSPSLDMNPYGQSLAGDSAIVNGNYYHRDGFGPPSYGHGSVGHKRMRVDDMGPSSFFMDGENNVNSSRFPSENERILKLIRDHGNAPSGPPQNWATLPVESKYESNRYVHEKFEELREVRDINDFQNPDIDYFDRKGASFHAEPGLNLYKYREAHGLSFGNIHMHSDRNDELGQSQYGRVENSLPHSLHYNKYSSQPTGRFTNAEQSRQSQDEVVHYYKGAIPYDSISQNSELEPRSPLPQSMHYLTTETLHENYHNFHRLPQGDNVSINESDYSHPTDNQSPTPYTMQHHLQPNRDFRSSSLPSEMRLSVGVNVPSKDGIQGSVGHQNFRARYDWTKSKEGHHPDISFGRNLGPREVSHVYNVQPPLPASPPPPLPIGPPGNHFSEPLASSPPPKISSSLFPIAVSSSAEAPSSHPPVPEAHSFAQAYYTNKPSLDASTGVSAEEFQACPSSSKKYSGVSQPFSLRHLSLEKPNVVDASHIFKQPHRTTRPDHLVIILRGLPGSGKSYLAKMLRDLEVENGGEAPRIHSMDEYFMTEVEKVEDSEASKSSLSVRGKRPVLKKVMEYCYEPEMEEAYRSSMLKAFKKTLDEGAFSFIIVDDRNLRVADFAQFWAIAKRSGYEVYLLEATYKDPAGCAARNVHGFTQDDIQKMAGQWEEAPSLYLKLDIKSLLHGDDLEESGIQEVDMDMEDGDPADGLQGSEVRNAENSVVALVDDFTPHGTLKDDKRWYPTGSHLTEVKELRRSKWSDDLDEDDFHGAEGRKGNSGALSGLIQAYSKEGKSVRWGDKVGNMGFSIGAAKKTNIMSLVIGPGSGYNLKSNPLTEEENLTSVSNAVESKRQSIFQERMRAERESFKAVFDKRRQRIGRLNAEEE